MSWGNKLLLVFLVFAGFMSYMVYRCTQVPVNLVTKEYYRDELAYQHIIDGTKKANALSGKIKIKQDAGYITVQLPAEMKNTDVKGNIQFYCPADVNRDRRFILQVDADAEQQFNTGAFLPGNYIVKVDWVSNNSNYYSEQPLTVHQ